MATTVVFSALLPDHAEILNEHRVAFEDLRVQMVANGWLRGGARPLKIVQEILERDLIPADSIGYQEVVGVAIGDQIVEMENYRWLTVTVDGQAEPAVCHPVKSVFISPLSAVIKRFARGERQFDASHFVYESIRIARENAALPNTGDIELA
ncbi:MAG TPA: DUF3806 domain-containing protein [Rhizomicrobium sp.]|jgi:hypothetical protein|nr:DUF3806 domain-containing protein [Rhizomicrobium sp.]